MKHISGSNFGVRFYRRAPVKKTVCHGQRTEKTVVQSQQISTMGEGRMRHFKKRELGMIFWNKVADVRVVIPSGVFKLSLRPAMPAPVRTKAVSYRELEAQAMLEGVLSTGSSLLKDVAKQRALWKAAQIGDCYAIRILVTQGVDIESRDSHGKTALMIAAENLQVNAVKTLLAAKEMRRMVEDGDLAPTRLFGRIKTA